jgi:hypothetical protein
LIKKQFSNLKINRKNKTITFTKEVLDFFDTSKKTFYFCFKYDGYTRKLLIFVDEIITSSSIQIYERIKTVNCKKELIECFFELYGRRSDNILNLKVTLDNSKILLNQKVIIINEPIYLHRVSKKKRIKNTISIFKLMTNGFTRKTK